MAESEKKGPFGDAAEDFAHLPKIKVMLMVRSVDVDEEFRNRCEIEVSRDENLFQAVERRVPFEEWYRLTAVEGGARSQLYKWHSESWFEAAPEVIRGGVKEDVERLQARLHGAGGVVSCVLLLEVREKVVETTRETEVSVSELLAELKLKRCEY